MTCQLDIGPNECVSCYNHGISSCDNKLVAFLNNISLTLTNNTNHVLLVTKKKHFVTTPYIGSISQRLAFVLNIPQKRITA